MPLQMQRPRGRMVDGGKRPRPTLPRHLSLSALPFALPRGETKTDVTEPYYSKETVRAAWVITEALRGYVRHRRAWIAACVQSWVQLEHSGSMSLPFAAYTVVRTTEAEKWKAASLFHIHACRSHPIPTRRRTLRNCTVRNLIEMSAALECPEAASLAVGFVVQTTEGFASFPSPIVRRASVVSASRRRFSSVSRAMSSAVSLADDIAAFNAARSLGRSSSMPAPTTSSTNKERSSDEAEDKKVHRRPEGAVRSKSTVFVRSPTHAEQQQRDRTRKVPDDTDRSCIEVAPTAGLVSQWRGEMLRSAKTVGAAATAASHLAHVKTRLSNAGLASRPLQAPSNDTVAQREPSPSTVRPPQPPAPSRAKATSDGRLSAEPPSRSVSPNVLTTGTELDTEVMSAALAMRVASRVMDVSDLPPQPFATDGSLRSFSIQRVSPAIRPHDVRTVNVILIGHRGDLPDWIIGEGQGAALLSPEQRPSPPPSPRGLQTGPRGKAVLTASRDSESKSNRTADPQDVTQRSGSTPLSDCPQLQAQESALVVDAFSVQEFTQRPWYVATLTDPPDPDSEKDEEERIAATHARALWILDGPRMGLVLPSEGAIAAGDIGHRSDNEKAATAVRHALSLPASAHERWNHAAPAPSFSRTMKAMPVFNGTTTLTATSDLPLDMLQSSRPIVAPEKLKGAAPPFAASTDGIPPKKLHKDKFGKPTERSKLGRTCDYVEAHGIYDLIPGHARRPINLLSPPTPSLAAVPSDTNGEFSEFEDALNRHCQSIEEQKADDDDEGAWVVDEQQPSGPARQMDGQPMQQPSTHQSGEPPSFWCGGLNPPSQSRPGSARSASSSKKVGKRPVSASSRVTWATTLTSVGGDLNAADQNTRVNEKETSELIDQRAALTASDMHKAAKSAGVSCGGLRVGKVPLSTALNAMRRPRSSAGPSFAQYNEEQKRRQSDDEDIDWVIDSNAAPISPRVPEGRGGAKYTAAAARHRREHRTTTYKVDEKPSSLDEGQLPDLQQTDNCAGRGMSSGVDVPAVCSTCAQSAHFGIDSQPLRLHRAVLSPRQPRKQQLELTAAVRAKKVLGPKWPGFPPPREERKGPMRTELYSRLRNRSGIHDGSAGFD